MQRASDAENRFYFKELSRRPQPESGIKLLDFFTISFRKRAAE
jgi:hypothetical protein